jgi:hypothetical protein
LRGFLFWVRESRLAEAGVADRRPHGSLTLVATVVCGLQSSAVPETARDAKPVLLGAFNPFKVQRMLMRPSVVLDLKRGAVREAAGRYRAVNPRVWLLRYQPGRCMGYRANGVAGVAKAFVCDEQLGRPVGGSCWPFSNGVSSTTSRSL